MGVRVTLRKIEEAWTPLSAENVDSVILDDLKKRNNEQGITFRRHLKFLAAILPDCFTPGKCKHSPFVITKMNTSMVNGLLSGNRKTKDNPASPVPGFTNCFISCLQQTVEYEYYDGSKSCPRVNMFDKIYTEVSKRNTPNSRNHPIFVMNQLTSFFPGTTEEVESEYQKVNLALNYLLEKTSHISISYAIFLLIVCAIVQDRIKEVSFLYAEESIQKVYEYQFGEKLIDTPSQKFGPFYDPYYFEHTYHVYKFREASGKLWGNCTLRMEQKPNGRPEATLIFSDGISSPVSGSSAMLRTYKGTPMYSPEDKMVFVGMTDEKDTFLMLSFPYHQFRFAPMYFRTGYILKASPTLGVPKAQKIAINAEPVAPLDIPYVEGLLKMDNDQLYLSRRQVDDFLEKFANYSWMKDFKKNYLPIFRVHQKKSGLYHFNSDEILSCSMSNLDRNDRIRILLALKSMDASNNPDLYKYVLCEVPKGTHKIFKYGAAADPEQEDS